MQVLEKILEEIEAESKLAHEEMRRCARENPLQFDEVKGYSRAMEYVVDTMRSHMNELPKCGECSRRKWYQKGYKDGKKDNGWIPIEERLPEEHNSMFAKFKGTSNWSNAMFEKMSDEVNVTIELEDGTRKTTTSYTLDGKWKVEKEQRVVKKKVIAWKPLPEPYKAKNNKEKLRKQER